MRKPCKSNPKNYYNHKQRLDEYWEKYVLCECGCIVSKSGMKRHLNTKKHQVLLLQNQNPVSQV